MAEITAVKSDSAKPFDKLKAYQLRVKNKLSYQEIADVLGCSYAYAYDMCKSIEQLVGDPHELAAQQSCLPDILTATRLKLIASVAQKADDSNASLKDRALAFEKIDKATRLELCQSTSNHALLSIVLGNADSKLFDKPK